MTSSKLRKAQIAWPASDVNVLFRSVAEALSPHLVRPIKSEVISYPGGDEHVSADVRMGAGRPPWHLHGVDAKNTRNTTGKVSRPLALNHHGAWVSFTICNWATEDEIAFMPRLAEDLGGFLTFDWVKWTTPAGPCQLAGLDERKWEILRKIGFEHAPSVGAMMDDDDVLRRVSELLQDEVSLRDEATPRPR